MLTNTTQGRRNGTVESKKKSTLWPSKRFVTRVKFPYRDGSREQLGVRDEAIQKLTEDTASSHGQNE